MVFIVLGWICIGLQIMSWIGNGRIPFYFATGVLGMYSIMYTIGSNIMLLIGIVLLLIGSKRRKNMVNSNADKTEHETPIITALCTHGLAKGNKATGEVLYIGSDPQLCQLVFPKGDPDIANVHCMLYTDGKNIELRDMKAASGIYLRDGTKLKPDSTIILEDGDSFYVGNQSNIISVMIGKDRHAGL